MGKALLIGRQTSFSSAFPLNSGNENVYSSVSQPPGRGPSPGPGVSSTGPREVLLEFVISIFEAIFMNKCFIVEIF